MKKLDSCFWSISFKILLLFFPLFGFSSNLSRTAVPSKKISGIIVDGDNFPVEFANVVLFKAEDSKLITGTVTDATGHFVLMNLEAGQYSLTASYIGYQEKRISNIVLSANSGSLLLDSIKIGQTLYKVGDVVVLGNTKSIENKLEKK